MTAIAPPPLTALYVPGDRPDRVRSALGSGADVVIIDLEDAVAASRKVEARQGLREALTPMPDGVSVQVRVNARDSEWHEDDLASLAGLPTAVGVRLPKVESPADVEAVAAALPGRDIHVLIESALGVERAFDVALAGIATLGLGEADLRSQLGLAAGREGEAGLLWIRSRIVVAAAAAGLPAPLMSAYANVADLEGLAESCASGHAMGMVGRSAIHPRQLPVIEAAFAPTEQEVARAREILQRVGEAAANGVGTVVLADGTFLDIAMVNAAHRTVGLAGRGAGS